MLTATMQEDRPPYRGGRVPDYATLLSNARYPDDPRTLALAGVIAQGLSFGERPLLRGLGEAAFARMMSACFPGMSLENGTGGTGLPAMDEYDDLVELLQAHGAEDSEAITWLCHAIATASLRNNHLWQDLGLPNRRVLSQLMIENFPSLAARNVGDMKWKKFFYRQLCEQAQVMICRSPNCAVCDDYQVCFGPEEGPVLVSTRGAAELPKTA